MYSQFMLWDQITLMSNVIHQTESHYFNNINESCTDQKSYLMQVCLERMQVTISLPPLQLWKRPSQAAEITLMACHPWALSSCQQQW